MRLRPEDLGRRLGGRRRKRMVRRLQLVAAVVVVAAVGLGAAWSIAQHVKPLAVSSAPISGPVNVTPSPATGSPWVNGLVGVTPSPAVGPGLSSGRATRPWSAQVATLDVHGRLRLERFRPCRRDDLWASRTSAGSACPYVGASAPGPMYQIQLVQPDQTSFSGSAANLASQASADRHSGSIAFHQPGAQLGRSFDRAATVRHVHLGVRPGEQPR